MIRPNTRSISTWHLLLAFAVLMTSGPIGVATGNPSSSHPERALATHGTIPGASELANKLYDLYRKHEAAAIDMNSRSDNPSRLPAKQIETSFADLYIALRDARRLRLMGEPAGVELENLINLLIKEYSDLATLHRNTTAGMARVQKNIAQLKRQNPRTEKALDKLVVEIKNNQLESAEKSLEQLERDHRELGCLLILSERSRYVERTTQTIADLDSKLSPLQRKQYFEEAKKAAARNLQDVSEFKSEAARVRTEIGAAGKVTIEGSDDLTTPAAIRYLAKEWGKASAALTRNVAIQWAFSNGSPSTIREKTMPQVSQLKAEAKDAFIALIDAAAVSTPVEQVPSVYSEILESLSYVDRRMSGSGISKDCQEALQRFAGKSPNLPAVIEAYQRAVAQPLHWRSRFARRHSEALKVGYSEARPAIAQEFQINEYSMPKIYRSPSPGERVLVTPSFATGASWKVADASKFIVGMRVSDNEILRLYAGSLTAITRLEGLHYSNVAIGMPINKEMNDLKISLVINDDHPPLSIEAADAISSGQSQDFLEFGGEIKQLHLEAAVTRLATLSGRTNQLVPLGTLPSIDDQRSAIEQATWRLDIEPHWVRHRYFTVAIPGKLPR